MSSILAICPTRQRVKKFKEMYESFKDTSRRSKLLAVIDLSDPQYKDYTKYLENNNVHFYINPTKSIRTYTQMLNMQFHLWPDYEYYHITNDDFIYKTQRWDERFIATLEEHSGGIAYGNDLYMGKNLPVSPLISRKIISTLGWLQLPSLTHLCGDMVWKVIGEGIKRLYYHNDVIIEHRHPLASVEIEKDDTFRKTNDPKMYHKDNEAFREWVVNQSYDDTKKVKDALEV